MSSNPLQKSASHDNLGLRIIDKNKSRKKFFSRFLLNKGEKGRWRKRTPIATGFSSQRCSRFGLLWYQRGDINEEVYHGGTSYRVHFSCSGFQVPASHGHYCIRLNSTLSFLNLLEILIVYDVKRANSPKVGDAKPLGSKVHRSTMIAWLQLRKNSLSALIRQFFCLRKGSGFFQDKENQLLVELLILV